MTRQTELVLAWHLHLTYPKLCCKEILVPSKIGVLLSGTARTLDIEIKFATAISRARVGQRVRAKARLQNGLTGRGGDKCGGGDASFRQNSLTTCCRYGTAGAGEPAAVDYRLINGAALPHVNTLRAGRQRRDVNPNSTTADVNTTATTAATGYSTVGVASVTSSSRDITTTAPSTSRHVVKSETTIASQPETSTQNTPNVNVTMVSFAQSMRSKVGLCNGQASVRPSVRQYVPSID